MLTSSRIQAAVVALAVALLVVINKVAKLGLDTTDIGAVAAAGGALVLAIAHIDNGEPAEPAPTSVPLTTDEKAFAKNVLTPAISAKLGLALLLGVALCGCGSLSGAYDGLTSPQGVADRAKLHEDYVVLRAKVEKDFPQLLDDVTAIAADVTAGNYIGALMAIVAAAPQLAADAPELLADVRVIIEDIRHLGADLHSVQQAHAAVSKAAVKAKAAKKAPA